MSRIGKEPVKVAEGVQVSIADGKVTVKGKLGELSYKLPAGISAEIKDGFVLVSRSSDARQEKAFHGLSRALIHNMVVGVSAGYTKQLDIEGVGFKFELKGQQLSLSIGYANPKLYDIPEGVTIKVGNAGLHLDISGISKELVGRVAADIRSFYPAEPYKGKGIRYTGEKIRRKEGKTVA